MYEYIYNRIQSCRIQDHVVVLLELVSLVSLKIVLFQIMHFQNLLKSFSSVKFQTELAVF